MGAPTRTIAGLGRASPSSTSALRSAAVLLGLLALVVPGAVVAQDGQPRITELQMNGKRVVKAPLGAAITILGSGFPADDAKGKHDEGLEITVGSGNVMLLSSTPDAMTVIIPQFGISKGKTKIKVKVRGRREVETDIELLDPDEYKKQMAEVLKGMGQSENGGVIARGPDVEDAVLAGFKISRFEFKRDATGTRFEAEGTTADVPDEFKLNLFLCINESRELEAQRVTIRNKTWRCTFGPYTQQVLFGNYSLNLLFELAKQDRVYARRFKPDPNLLGIYSRVFRREFVTVGTEQEVKDQYTAMQAHFRALCASTTALLGQVEKAYASGCRIFFRPQGQQIVNQAQYSAYLQQMGFARTADELKALNANFDYATAAGHFKPEEYLKWAQGTFVPAVQAEFTKHRDFRGQTVQPVDPKADMLGDYLISIVFELFRQYSQVLYERAKVPLPDLFAASPIDPVAAPTISRPFFEAQRRLLLRTVGLGNVIPAGEGDKDADQGPATPPRAPAPTTSAPPPPPPAPTTSAPPPPPPAPTTATPPPAPSTATAPPAPPPAGGGR